MPWLYVTVRLHDVVVEERLCAVADELWLGDAPEARIAFPGARLRVRRLGDRLQVEGRWLDLGMRLRAGPVEVHLEAVPVAGREPSRFGRLPASGVPDVRLLVASAAMVLFGAWLDSTWRFLEANPTVLAQAQAALLTGEVDEHVATARPTTSLPVFAVEETFELPPREAAERREEWPPTAFRP